MVGENRTSGMLGLASTSIGRRELFKRARLNFIAISPKIDEYTIIKNLELHTPENIVINLAKEKAKSAYHKLKSFGADVVIAGDTVVYDSVNNRIIGKPKTINDTVKIIKELQGRSHKIYSSVVVKASENEELVDYDITEVWFKKLDDKEINDYAQNFRPFYFAGGYEVIGLSSFFVEKIDGNITTVIGLPMHKLHYLLKKAGYYWFEFVKNEQQ